MIQAGLTKIFNSYKTDFSKALLHTGVLTYTLSSAAQTCAIILNDKTQKADKKYLINQEIAEGAVNIALFYTICRYIKDKTEKMLHTGNITSTSTEEVLKDLNAKNVKDAGKYFDTFLMNNPNHPLCDRIQIAKDHLRILKPFAVNLAAFAAAILASNIIAPICRNLAAGYLHKKEQKVMNFSDFEQKTQSF